MICPNTVRKRFHFLLLSALILSFLSSPGASQAAPQSPELSLPLPNVVVNTTAIADDPGDGKCDLWEALQSVFQANYGMSPTYHECTAKVSAQNIIGFSVVGGTITIPIAGPRTDLPFVHGNTVIVGPITIAGGSASADTHLLRTAPGANLTVIAVVLKNGHTTGAGPAIYSDNYATVNVIASFLINNTADSAGGAIYTNGDLNVMGTSFANNQVKGLSGSGAGGAIFVTGTGSFKSEASTFTANQAVTGGAIYLDKSGGDSSISDSIFTANNVSSDANGFGGGALAYLNNNGKLEINRSAFNGNFSTQGLGGAIVNKINSVMEITNTIFDANSSGDPAHATDGGAIFNQGNLTISKSTLVANVAQGSGGALVNGNAGIVRISNTTFNSNIANSQGGAILASSGSNSMAIRNSTFASNNASGQGGIIYLAAAGKAQVGNTILDGSTTLLSNCAGSSLTSLGHNIDTGASCGLNGSGDMNNTNPLLGPLGFHGGGLPVLTTQQPSYSSPAIDQGDAAICADPDTVNNEDETGSKRPKDANNTGNQACDIGAVELDVRKPAFDAQPMPPGPINLGSAQVNHSVTTSFTVHNAGNYLLSLSNPNLVDAAHFAVVTPFPIDVNAGATQTITLSCTPSISGLLTTTLSFDTTDPDHSSVSYSLLCTGVPQPAPAFASLPTAPGPLEFGEVPIGQTATKSITIKNNGTADLLVNPGSFKNDSGNFTHSLAAQMTVAPGASDQIDVDCQPNRVGALAGSLTVQTNDSSQSSASYQLNCNGVPPQSAYLVNTENLKNPYFPSNFASLFGIATSPDGLNAYVNGNASTDGEVVVMKRSTSGLLAGSYLPTTSVTDALLFNPHEMKVSPDGQFVLVTAGANNTLMEYRRDGGNGDLTWAKTYSGVTSLANGNLSNPYGLAFSPDSQFVYVTNYTGNSISIFKHIGSAYFYTGLVTATSNGAHPLTNPAGIVVSPDGKHVYVSVHTATASAGTLAAYQRDPATGDLTPIQTRFQGDLIDAPGCMICFPVTGLASTYQLAISPDGSNVYVTSWYNHSVANFRRDPVSGLLRWYGTISNNSIGGSGLTNAFGIAVSPDGKHVYATGYGDNTLVMFDREKLNGYLTYREKYQRDPGTGVPALNGVYQTAVSSDGQYVFAVGQFDKAVAVFRIANPLPVLFSLQPASINQGSAQFTLVVKGNGFVSGANVSWDGYNPDSTFINSSEMRAVIPASYLTNAGTHTIKVTNPGPGGGVSFNTLTLQVLAPSDPPVPSIDHLNPAGVEAGATGVQVDIYGSNFQSSGLTVTANGSGVIHSFINSTHVRITAFNANTFAQPGTVNIQVNNNGVKSNMVGLDVAAAGQNPAPSITAVNPVWVWSFGAGSSDQVLTVTGSNFIDGSVVQLNGSDRPTKFIDSTTLQATIYGMDQLSPANNSITVVNPLPGGGSSNTLTFTVWPLLRTYVPVIKR